ncbi:copper resistance protein B [Luteimonas sp. MJ174]|uniref:copper resistance protein B n=1 Tax=Luteimonas sp. MJ174 TaxID=3129237 RepID=UPI0031B9F5A0
MIRSSRHPLAIGLASALSLAAGFAPAWAQQTDHTAHHPEAKPAATQPPAKPVDPHADHEPTPPDKSSHDHGSMDHGDMDHGAMKHGAADTPRSDHSTMDHSTMDHSTMDHSTMDHSQMDHSGMDYSGMDHSGMDHASMGHQPGASQDLPPTAEPHVPIPVVTPADRAAAFQDLDAHVVHGESINSYWALDRLEAWDADEHGTGMAWEAKGWIGSDLNKVWLRSGGERAGGSTESADVEVLYGRAIAPWWDAVAGVRHDFGFGGSPSRTYAALGVIGLAPYKFEVEATAYLGESGQVGLAAEAEYEMLFTNRLIGQWLIEGEAWSKDDPAAGIGSGLSTIEAGFRLRYEFRRQFAPYVGVVWERAYGGTADQRSAQSGDIDDTRIVAGVRIWF